MLRIPQKPTSSPVANKSAAPAGTGSGGNLKIGKLSANQEYPKSGSPATSRTSVKSQVKRKPLILPSKTNGTYKAPNTSLKPKLSLRLPNRPTSAAPAKSHNHLVAERLAAHGASVFPCEAKDQPLVKWKTASTTDPARINESWRQHPNALPAIDLAKSDLIVIDADRHGGPDGVAALQKLMGGNLHRFNAPIVQTPNDGEPLLVASLQQFMDESCGGVEANRQSFLAGREAEPE